MLLFKTKYKLIVIMFVFGLSIVANAQQTPQFSLFVFNNYLINPAAGGMQDHIKVNLGYRSQWIGFDSAPKTFFVSCHAPVTLRNKEPKAEDNHHGVGGYIATDETGPISQVNLYGSYAYHMRFSYQLWGSVGFFTGFKHYKLDPTTLFTASPNDVDLIPVSSFVPDLTLGGWLYNDNFFTGFTINQILNTQVRPSEIILEKHYALSAGYKFYFKQTNSDLIYTSHLKMGTVSPMQMDFSVRYNYRQVAWLGFSYRKVDAIIGVLGFNPSKHLEIGYAYDITLSKIKGYSSNTHEIMIGIRFKQPKKRTKIKCPTWG